ncbi:voltage-gated potassium channel, partial [Periconia macrospinosa]
SDWWWASTLFPMLGATLGPLANISSIAALVTSWRQQVYINGEYVSELDGTLFADPRWCYWLNVASLICGFLGNLFLLFNFTQRIRYLIALPATIFFWYLASGMLIGITVSMEVHAPPYRPEQTYTQGFWYAICAAALYLFCSTLLMINMLGYFLRRYPDTFVLSDSQRTLILQTMVFFIWLGGGAAIFSQIETAAGQSSWNFTNAIYFCDVTILTVGFGDFYPTTDVSRGIIIPYSLGGIVILALIVNSIYKFMREIGEQNIIKKHTERIRVRTLDRAVTNSFDLRQREREAHHLIRRRAWTTGMPPNISMPTEPRPLRTTITEKAPSRQDSNLQTLAVSTQSRRKKIRKPRAILLREERDRFYAMRDIQHRSRKFRKWMALAISVFSFGILWCVGAVVFWKTEKNTQGMSYPEALYFCYIALLTIGYGDMAPKSNAGRTFFVIWSLIAVPTITVLVSDMADTVVHKFKKWSDELADFTVLPKYGIWRDFLEAHPWLLYWIVGIQTKRAMEKRLKRGFETQLTDSPPTPSGRNAVHQRDDSPASASLGKRLAYSIGRVAADLRNPTPKKYEYEEWVEFTQLIRLSRDARMGNATEGEDEEEEGLVEWDWIGTESPMMSGMSESEWLLHRLCESLIRI